MAAWEMKETLPEFEERPQEQQDWAVAAWRTKKKLDRISLIASLRD
jgi:hypothetical protein